MSENVPSAAPIRTHKKEWKERNAVERIQLICFAYRRFKVWEYSYFGSFGVALALTGIVEVTNRRRRI